MRAWVPEPPHACPAGQRATTLSITAAATAPCADCSWVDGCTLLHSSQQGDAGDALGTALEHGTYSKARRRAGWAGGRRGACVQAGWLDLDQRTTSHQ